MPSMIVASVASTEPPTSVQARPVAKPISLCFSSQYFAVLQNAEEIVDVVRGDFDTEFVAFGDDVARHLARDVLNFALEVAHAGFMRVVPDDVQQAFVGELEVFLRQAGGFARALYQEALGDFELFLLGVARAAAGFPCGPATAGEWCAARWRCRRT